MNIGKIAVVAVMAAFASASCADSRRWFVVNVDNDHFFKCDSSLMNEKGLEEYIDYLCRGKATHVFFCVAGQRASYDSSTWEPIWAGLDEPARPDTATAPDGTRDRWAVNAKKLHDAGIDPYEVWIRRCREKGVSAWVSLRMNDVHSCHVTNYFRNTTFFKTRTDLRLDPTGKSYSLMQQLDYAHAEVRDYHLAQIREMARRWQSDGVELDWMRFGHVFKPGEETKNAPLLDGFMREASSAIRAAGRKIAVRVPYDPRVCEEFGFNVVKWAKEGLVDVIVPAPFIMAASDLPVEDWKEALAGTKTVLVPDVGCEVGCKDRSRVPAVYRGIAKSFIERGADGVYIYNLPYKSNVRYSTDSRGKAWYDKMDVAAEICSRGIFPDGSADMDYDCPVSVHDWPYPCMRNDARWDAFFASKRPAYLALQAKIDAAAASGGGRVEVTGTMWCDGPLRLRSGVELHLAEGSRLVFTDNPDRYPAVRSSWEGVECINRSPLVYAFAETNVAVTGRGTIAPRIERWKAWMKRTPAHLAATRRLYDWCSSGESVDRRDLTKIPGADVRPQLVQFNRCSNVRLEDFRVRQSPFWVLHLYLCRGVHVKGVDIIALGNNSDGIDIEMTRDVLVEDCTFRQGDDAIVIKSGRNHDGWRLATPSENIEIRNCTVRRGNSVVGIGSEMSGGVRNVWVHDCTFDGFGGSLLHVKTNERRGGFVKDIRLERIKARGLLVHGLLEIAMDCFYQWKDFPTHEVRIADISGISLKDIHAERVGRRVSIREDGRRPVRDVTLENVVVEKARLPDMRVHDSHPPHP